MSTRPYAYEIDCLLLDPQPNEYWLHQLCHGRRTKKWGPFSTEKEARDAADMQMDHDDNDRDRARLRPEEE